MNVANGMKTPCTSTHIVLLLKVVHCKNNNSERYERYEDTLHFNTHGIVVGDGLLLEQQ